jgi:hypothetical protein
MDQVTLHLRDVGKGDAPAEVRLRRALKVLLRSHGWQCTRVIETSVSTDPPADWKLKIHKKKSTNRLCLRVSAPPKSDVPTYGAALVYPSRTKWRRYRGNSRKGLL